MGGLRELKFNWHEVRKAECEVTRHVVQNLLKFHLLLEVLLHLITHLNYTQTGSSLKCLQLRVEWAVYLLSLMCVTFYMCESTFFSSTAVYFSAPLFWWQGSLDNLLKWRQIRNRMTALVMSCQRQINIVNFVCVFLKTSTTTQGIAGLN